MHRKISDCFHAGHTDSRRRMALLHWWSLEKISIKLVELMTILNKILKVPMFPPCTFAYMTSWCLMRLASPQTFHCLKLLLFNVFKCKIYLSDPQQVRRGHPAIDPKKSANPCFTGFLLNWLFYWCEIYSVSGLMYHTGEQLTLMMARAMAIRCFCPPAYTYPHCTNSMLLFWV